MNQTLDPRKLNAEAEAKLQSWLQQEDHSPKARRAIEPQPMPSQEPDERRHNMKEVALGYSPAQAQLEANRCLQCPNQPCVEGCPVKVPIRDFLGAAARGDFKGALSVIRQQSLLPAICGRVCPQEQQCQARCTVGKLWKNPEKAVAIGRIERFVADRETAAERPETQIPPPTGRRVAVIGSGPAGLACAADVRRAGHEVTVFEAFHKFGGVMLYGIPEFRLPKRIVEDQVESLRKMGIRFVPNFLVGRTRKLTDLLEKDGFDAVFIGTGAGLPHFMNIPGEELIGVFAANEFLTRSNLMRAYDRDHAATPLPEMKHVAILGGGNVAMDAARTALRLGAEEVSLIYRRTEAEMPARREEVEHAREEGVNFRMLTNAVRVLGDDKGFVTGLVCRRYELGEPDASGRRSPVAIPGSDFEIAVDTVIVAIGNGSNPLLRQTTPGLNFNERGCIVVDENCRTSLPGVYAGGDIVKGAATVIFAMGQGRVAAAAINQSFLDGKANR
ncbi:MAG: NADPH-dependent glutamate synthase [Lentisphaerae bacterium]|nr:NADPH-dependent glutamate synthase [Lentisphaerota bacterium]